MFTDYLIVVSSIATLTLIWRNLKEDHPEFKSWIKNLPVFGEALSCGFCASLWMTLAVVLCFNPIAAWSMLAQFSGYSFFVLAAIAGWLSVGAGVLLLRSLIIVLLELGAVLKHQHRGGHGAPHEEKK